MTEHTPPRHAFPGQFQHYALELITALLPMTSCVFYLVGTDMRHRGVALHNLDPQVEQDYHNHFRHLDPLNPAKFEHTDIRVANIDDQMDQETLYASPYYQRFMQPYDHRYVMDMFLRQSEQIIAVISCLRREVAGAFSGSDKQLLEQLQPFLEYTLNLVYGPKRAIERQLLQERYTFTPRELDVLELLLTGASNKRIANELSLGLATVKTHIQHVFQKTATSSRTALFSRVLADLGDGLSTD